MRKRERYARYARRVRAYARKRTIMNKEYLEAKVDLFLNQAAIDIKQQEIARAIKNLERANSALSRIFNMEEGDNNE